ncbi:unnamed protein product, partial [Cyprideis torosa]
MLVESNEGTGAVKKPLPPNVREELALELIRNLTHPDNYSLHVKPPQEPVNVQARIFLYYITGFSTVNTTFARMEKERNDARENSTVTFRVQFLDPTAAQKNREFTVQALFQYVWRDERLDFSHVPDIPVIEGEGWLEEMIWTPNIYFVNEKDSEHFDVIKKNVFVAILPNGTVSYNFRLKLTLSCKIDLKKFPFDQQHCHLLMESWTYYSHELLLSWNQYPIQINPDFYMPEYDLQPNMRTEEIFMDYPQYYESGSVDRQGFFGRNGNYSALAVHFIFKRQAVHYIFDFYFPSMMLVAISWTSFWIDPMSAPARVTCGEFAPARVAGGTATVLTFITLSKNMEDTLPKVSYIKAVEVWFFVCCVFIFMTLMEFAFVHTLARRARDIRVQNISSRNIIASHIGTPMGSRPSSRRGSMSSLRKSLSAPNITSMAPKSDPFDMNGGPNSAYLTVDSALGKEFQMRRNSLNPANSEPIINNSDDVHDIRISVPVTEYKISTMPDGSCTPLDKRRGSMDLLKPQKQVFMLNFETIPLRIERDKNKDISRGGVEYHAGVIPHSEFWYTSAKRQGFGRGVAMSGRQKVLPSLFTRAS